MTFRYTRGDIVMLPLTGATYTITAPFVLRDGAIGYGGKPNQPDPLDEVALLEDDIELIPEKWESANAPEETLEMLCDLDVPVAQDERERRGRGL